MANKINAYKGKTDKYLYPSNDLSKEEKQKKNWYKQNVEAMMADYTSGNYAIPYGEGNRYISENRAYAKGLQSQAKIKKAILGKSRENADGTYSTAMNISFDGYAKMPQLLDIVRSKNMPEEYDIDLSCIDEDSVAAMESTRAAMKYWVDERTRNFLRNSQYKPDFEPNPEEIGLRTSQDVDTWFDTGGFTLQWQMAAKAAFLKSKEVGGYKEFQDRIFDDLITIAFAGGKSTIDKSTGYPVMEYVDPEMAVCPNFDGFCSRGKIARAGVIKAMTIADLRSERPDMDAAELIQVAKDYQWMNPKFSNVLAGRIAKDHPYATRTESYDLDLISRVKVLVFDAQWLSPDVDEVLRNEDSGLRRFVDSGYKVSRKAARDGDYVVKKKVIRKYEASWVIGTDCFLKMGPCENSAYYGPDGNKTPELDFVFVKTNNMSLVERCVALIDDINMAIVKLRNIWATLPAAPGLMIQSNLLEDVMLNGVLQQPEDVIQAYIERGILYYNGLDDNGDPLFLAGGQKPIDYQDFGKLGSLITICQNEVAQKLFSLKEVLGLQGGADGGDRDRYQGWRETELAFEASNASLMPTFNSFRYLLLAMAHDNIKLWQIISKDKKINLSLSLLGNKNMKMIELSKEFSYAEYNIVVKIAPSRSEKEGMLAELRELRGINLQNPSMGITYSEYIYVHQKVMAGNIDEAHFVLAMLERKRKMEAEEKERMNQEYTIRAQQESAAQKAESDLNLQTEKNKGQMDVAKLSADMKILQEMLSKAIGDGKGEGGNGSPVDKELALAIASDKQAEVDDALAGNNLEGESQ